MNSALLVIMLCATITPQTNGQTTSDSVYSIVETFFTALAEQDTTTMSSILAPDGHYFAVTPADSGATNVQRTTNADFLTSLPNYQRVITERMWDPTILVNDYVALVWGSYDLYIGNELSHCGNDAFTLVNWSGSWRIAGVAFTVEKGTCSLHPDGPPFD